MCVNLSCLVLKLGGYSIYWGFKQFAKILRILETKFARNSVN